jgi:hypothetical protein
MSDDDPIRRGDILDGMNRFGFGGTMMVDAIEALPAYREMQARLAEVEAVQASERRTAEWTEDRAKEYRARAVVAEARVQELEGALTKASNRLHWAAGLLPTLPARTLVSGWAAEATLAAVKKEKADE